MTSLSISSRVFDTEYNNSNFVLNDSHLKTSQVIRSFCEQATEIAPLFGMMLGNLAAPLVRFQSSRLLGQLLGKEGYLQSVVHASSWVCGAFAEGFLMTATPEFIRGERLSIGLLKGTTHATLTMMVCEGISKRVPLGRGVLSTCGQDLGVMLVNWGSGELGISEKVQGGIIDQWVEARVVSMRIAVSGWFVRAALIEGSYVRSKYDLENSAIAHKINARERVNPIRDILSENMHEIMVPQLVTPEGITIKVNWESSIQKTLRESQLSFMAKKEEDENSSSSPLRGSPAGDGLTRLLQALLGNRENIKITIVGPGEFLPASQSTQANLSAETMIKGTLELLLGTELSESFPSSTQTVKSIDPFIKTRLMKLNLGDYFHLPREWQNSTLMSIYDWVAITINEIRDPLSNFISDIPDAFIRQENLDFSSMPYSQVGLFPIFDFDTFSLDFGKTIQKQPLPESTLVTKAIERFLISRLCVTTPSGVDFLTRSFLEKVPTAKIRSKTERKTSIVIPTSSGLDYTLTLHANRVMARVNPDQGISMKELLRLQDIENDLATVFLVQRQGERELIVRAAAAAGGLTTLPGDTLIAHTHPWAGTDLSDLTPGDGEIQIAQYQQNTQVGIYRTGMVIFHSRSQVLRSWIGARRGKISFLPFSPEEDFLISAKDKTVWIEPISDNSKPDWIRTYPVVDVTFPIEGDPIFMDDGIEIDQANLLKHFKDKSGK